MPNYTPCERAPSKGAPLTAAGLTEADEVGKADKAAASTSRCLGFIRSPYSIIALLAATTSSIIFLRSLEIWLRRMRDYRNRVRGPNGGVACFFPFDLCRRHKHTLCTLWRRFLDVDVCLSCCYARACTPHANCNLVHRAA